MPTPTIPQPMSIAGRDALDVDETSVRKLHALGLRREVLEASSLAIVEIDMQRHIRYANPAAIRMLGVPENYFDLSIDRVFVDDQSKKLVDQEIERYAERSGRTPPAVRAALEKEGGLSRIYTGLRREKAIDFLMAHATIAKD